MLRTLSEFFGGQRVWVQCEIEIFQTVRNVKARSKLTRINDWFNFHPFHDVNIIQILSNSTLLVKANKNTSLRQFIGCKIESTA